MVGRVLIRGLQQKLASALEVKFAHGRFLAALPSSVSGELQACDMDFALGLTLHCGRPSCLTQAMLLAKTWHGESFCIRWARK